MTELREALGPEAYADAYLDWALAANLSRDAQAVWRQARASGIGASEAAMAHAERFHADQSDNARSAMVATLAAEVEPLIALREAIITVEFAELDRAFARQWVVDAFGDRLAGAGELFDGAIGRFASVGAPLLPGETYSLGAAAVAVQVASEQARGVHPSQIPAEGSCLFYSFAHGSVNSMRRDANPEAASVLRRNEYDRGVFFAATNNVFGQY